jgi:hypothetical protein
LPIDNDIIEINKESVNINNNIIFQNYKYAHIAKAFDGIPDDFKKFASENNAAQLEKGTL